MATKYICDRCGGEIQGRAMVSHFAVFQVLLGKLKSSTKEYELCPDCHDKVRAFLAGAGMDVRTSEQEAE